MLRKILFACCLMGLTVSFIAGCEPPKPATKTDKPAASSEAKPGARPVAPPHAPGNS